MYRATIRATTDAESAFGYLSRFDRATEWDPSVVEASMLTPEPVGNGSRFRLVSRFAGRGVVLEYEITEYVPFERLVLRAETRWIRSTDTITFAPDGLRSTVQYDALLETKGVAHIADPVIAAVFKRLGDRAVAGLRAHLSAIEPT